MAKLKNHWVAGVTMTMMNNFGNTPCSLYGGDCGPSGNEQPTQERVAVLHEGTTRAPSGVDAELHPDSPRDPGYRVPRILVDQNGIRPIDPGDHRWRRDRAWREKVRGLSGLEKTTLGCNHRLGRSARSTSTLSGWRSNGLRSVCGARHFSVHPRRQLVASRRRNRESEHVI